MVVITPGVDSLVTGSCILSLPVFGTIALRKLYERLEGSGTTIPAWVPILAGIASLPCIVTLRIAITRLRHKREAAAMGAKMIPSNLGKWPGNVDVLSFLQDNFLHGYPGMYDSFYSNYPN